MAVAAATLRSEGLKNCPISSEQLQSVAAALLEVLQDGLEGNRAVSNSVWSVVTAATRAYPIQLSPSVEKAQAVADACPSADLVETWALQAVTDGSFIILLQKLAHQPQILTAYARDATVRNAKAVEQLVSQLQELKGLITVMPYDACLQHKPAATPVHVQTEDDLPRQGQHYHQQQQQQQHEGAQQHHSHGTGSSTSSQKVQPAQSAAQTMQQPVAVPAKQQGLARLFQRTYKRDKATGGGSVDTGIAVANDEHCKGQRACQASKQPMLLQVKLLVAKSDEAVGNSRQRLVQLQLQVLLQDNSNTASQSNSSSNTSNSRLLGAGAGAVKGIFHSLQQSASVGLQHGTAAGQEIGVAVAAAGEVAFGAISQPFAAVKGFAARAGGGKQTNGTNKGARIPQAAAELAQATTAAASTTGKSVSGLFALRKSSATAASTASAFGKSTPAAPGSDTSPFKAGTGSPATTPALQAKLHVTADPGTPVQLVIIVLPETEVAGSQASSSQLPSWPSTKGLLGKLGMGRSSGSSNREYTGGASAYGSTAVAGNLEHGVPSEASAAPDEDHSRDSAGALEGDMWSVMERLRHTASGLVPRHSSDFAIANNADATAAVASPTAAAAAEAAMLEHQGQTLLQELLDCCNRVLTAATFTKGSLGDDTEAVIQLVALVQALLNHGLRNAINVAAGETQTSTITGISKAAAAREVLGGWVPTGKTPTTFGVLQALQHGSKRHPRLMLGADGIANMKAAKFSPPAVKLDMWVRASLNEQLLGVRLSTLAANPSALGAWYHPCAMLLQPQAMQPVLQQMSQLCSHKFALAVGTVPVVTAPSNSLASAVASSTSSSTSVIPDPRKLLGGLSTLGLGMLSGFGSGTVAATDATGTDSSNDAAAAAPAASHHGNVASAGGSGGSNIPTFLWSSLGSSVADSSSNPAGGPAAGASGGGGGGGLFRRRRVAQIKEVRVPPPDSAAVLSPEASCALSPVSAAGDAAYAEWWSPNSSWQDFGKADGLETATSGDGGGRVSRSSSASGNVGGGVFAVSSSGAACAEVVGEGNLPIEQQQFSRCSSNNRTGSSEVLTSAGIVPSEAAVRLEQELAAAMNAPVANILGAERARRSGSSSGSSSCGGAGSSKNNSSQGLHRSSSAGWEAAVARARSSRPASTMQARVGAGLGVMGHHQMPLLNRRSRSPDASWSVAASGDSSQTVGSAAAIRRVPRHMHKRSSSLNDLPGLQALLESGELLQKH